MQLNNLNTNATTMHIICMGLHFTIVLFSGRKSYQPAVKKGIFSFQQWGIKHIGYSETPIKWTPNRTDDSNPWSSTRSKRNNSSDNETNSVELSNLDIFLLLKNLIYTFWTGQGLYQILVYCCISAKQGRCSNGTLSRG